MEQDCVSKWINEAGDVPILLIAGHDSYHKEYYLPMIDGNQSRSYNTNESQEETEEMIKNRIKIGTKEWRNGMRKPRNEKENGLGRWIKVCMYICIYICICMYMYVYMYI
jgi:hypothetical protein